MADTGSPGGGRPSRGSGASFTVHLADELEVYFNEVAHGRPRFVASPNWKPPTDVYETDDALVVHMDIAGMRVDDFRVELSEGLLKISGERLSSRGGPRHYHAMEVQVGPFERRLRLPVRVDPASLRTSYEAGFLEVWLHKLPSAEPEPGED
jgi:HSP20 family molecular chaperone IbpA